MVRMTAEREHTGIREFPVDLPMYQGPFRALAELILAKKVDVCDVPLAGVVDAFLAKADEAEGWTLEEATWFLATCAVLLEMKVRRLLPKPDKPLDEEDLLGTSPDLVFARRRELAAFRRVAKDLARRMEESARHVPRDAGPPEGLAHLYPDVLEHVTPQDLAEAAAAMFRPPPMVDLSHVTPIRLTVAEAVETVVGKLEGTQRSRFRELVADCTEAIEVVVRFLAVLELHKEGRLVLSQAETFGEIEVAWGG